MQSDQSDDSEVTIDAQGALEMDSDSVIERLDADQIQTESQKSISLSDIGHAAIGTALRRGYRDEDQFYQLVANFQQIGRNLKVDTSTDALLETPGCRLGSPGAIAYFTEMENIALVDATTNTSVDESGIGFILGLPHSWKVLDFETEEYIHESAIHPVLVFVDDTEDAKRLLKQTITGIYQSMDDDDPYIM